jgi:hypothetical protein
VFQAQAKVLTRMCQMLPELLGYLGNICWTCSDVFNLNQGCQPPPRAL